MQPLKNVGRAPNSDASMVTAGWVDERHAGVAVTPQYITDRVAAHAATVNLVDKAYVDAGDATRAKKAAVDAADANYVPLSARGSTVASLDAGAYIPPAQLPMLLTERPSGFVEASRIFFTTSQLVASTTTKTYQAAVCEIADPGYPYQVLPMATICGVCPEPIDGLRRVGGSSRGKMTVLASDDTLFGGGVAANIRSRTFYSVIPTALQAATPTVVEGPLTLHLWLALHSGTVYRFEPTGFRFFCLLFPAA